MFLINPWNKPTAFIRLLVADTISYTLYQEASINLATTNRSALFSRTSLYSLLLSNASTVLYVPIPYAKVLASCTTFTCFELYRFKRIYSRGFILSYVVSLSLLVSFSLFLELSLSLCPTHSRSPPVPPTQQHTSIRFSENKPILTR